MPVVKCPHCKQPTTIPANAAGRKATCPHCRKAMMIPGAKPAARSATQPATRPVSPPPKKKTPWRLIGGGGGAAIMLAILAVWLTRSPARVEKERKPEEKHVAKYDPPPVVAPKKAAPKTNPPIEEPPPSAEAIAAQMTAAVDRINAMRLAAKLKPVAVDPDLSRGCQGHAEYMIRNLADLTAASALTEDSGRPGYSDAGKQAAQVSISTRVDPMTTAEFCLGQLAKRMPLLHPNLERIGIGTHVSAKREWATVLDAVRGYGTPYVVYPAAGQTDVPIACSAGPECPPGGGFPVTLQFFPPRPVAGLEASLADENGNQIDTLSWTPDKAADAPFRAGLIGILPKARLRPKSTYKARVAGTIDGRPFDAKWEFATEDDGDDDGARAAAALERVNEFRKLAGVPPVELDDILSRGCRAHATYLALNARRPEAQGLNVHEEHESLPGFSPEGRKAAKAADINIGDVDPVDAVDGWMATLYHRIPILEPTLKSVGFGCARGDRGGWISVLDVQNGRDLKASRTGPVLFPAENQTGVPLEFPGNELPNPLPEESSDRAGYPITVFFPAKEPLAGAAAKLEDAKGRPVDCWFSSPESLANPKHLQGTAVCLIPKEPLLPEHRYRATFSGEQLRKPWRKSWTFTTTKKHAADAGVQTALARINDVRKAASLLPVELDAKQSIGSQAHADYLALNLAKLKAVNDEDSALPGYTPAGQRAARGSAIFSKAPRTTTQIDDLTGGLLFRGFFLDPKLRKVSLGCARESGGGWINVLSLRGIREEGTPVFCPAPGQEKVPIEGRDRLPDDPKVDAGFPVSVWFPGQPTIRNVRASLAEATGTTVDIWLSTPDSPFDASEQRDVIAIHPRRPLKTGTIYTVNITADIAGAEWTANWRFSTAK